jgi:integrase
VAKPTTVQQAWDEWLALARDGAITNRSGHPYKPSALRCYDQAMRLRVLPVFRSTRLAEITRPDLQSFANTLISRGLNPSTIGGAFLPLRAVYRRALSLGTLAINPCAGIELPAVRGRRERFASPEEAAALIAAVPKEADRVIWATAMYAGLRRGELRALRRGRRRPCDRRDQGRERLGRQRGRDRAEVQRGPAPRSHQRCPARLPRSTRRLQRPDCLRAHLRRQAVAGVQLAARADEAWGAAGLARITLHECRHTFASLMIAAGVNAKALWTFMGHATIAITLDRYGHLMPGSEAEAALLLDGYLDAQKASAEQAARAAGVGVTGA